MSPKGKAREQCAIGVTVSIAPPHDGLAARARSCAPETFV